MSYSLLDPYLPADEEVKSACPHTGSEFKIVKKIDSWDRMKAIGYCSECHRLLVEGSWATPEGRAHGLPYHVDMRRI